MFTPFVACKHRQSARYALMLANPVLRVCKKELGLRFHWIYPFTILIFFPKTIALFFISLPQSVHPVIK